MCICPDYVRFVCVPALDVAFSFLFLRVPHFHDNASLTQPRAHRVLPISGRVWYRTRGGDCEGGIRRRAVQGHGRVLPGFQLRRRRRGRRRRDRTRTSTRYLPRAGAIRSAHDSTIVETTFDSAVMREEVFGPVLAIVPVPSVDDALRLVN